MFIEFFNQRKADVARSSILYMLYRSLIVLLSSILLYVRLPSVFRHPGMWAEDGNFFSLAYQDGLGVFKIPFAGYLLFVQSSVAYTASFFDTVYAARIYCYAALLIVALVIWIVTSPRLVLPCKFILAFAIVLVPMGQEELGNLTNIQWILPIGAFALLFMRPASSPLLWMGEVLFIAVMSLSGPFSIFLAPLFVVFWYFGTPGRDRARLLLLGAVCGLGAVTQILVIATHGGQKVLAAAAPYDWKLWINLPVSRIATDFGPVSDLFVGRRGVVLSMVLIGVGIAVALRRPHRVQKLAILYFSTAIAIGGMYKFRDLLGTQIDATRYFYVGSVLLLWFIALAFQGRKWKYAASILIIGTEMALIPAIADTPLDRNDLHWAYWAAHVKSGVPVIIPTSPAGFYVDLPADPAGALASYAMALGKPIAALALPNGTFCKGRLAAVSALPDSHFTSTGLGVAPSRVWLASGLVSADRQGSRVDLILLTDRQDAVVGFGFPNYPADRWIIDGDNGRQWKAIFISPGGGDIHAYAIGTGGAGLCPLEGALRLPGEDETALAPKFVMAAEILPETEIVQQFKASPMAQGVAVAFVTWGHDPSPYTVDWRLEARSAGAPFQQVGAGVIEARSISDWQSVTLPFSRPRPAAADEVRLSISTQVKARPAFPLGVPLFENRGEDASVAASINGVQAVHGARVQVTGVD